MKLLEKNIEGKNIFFTDESKIDCTLFINEYIRLSKENIEKLKKGDKEALKLMEKEVNKFPKRIMVAGGISYYGLSDLMILEGNLMEFSYAQAILIYKKNLKKFKRKNKGNDIIFKQDEAPSHTSK